jgi:hypothetical protein
MQRIVLALGALLFGQQRRRPHRQAPAHKITSKQSERIHVPCQKKAKGVAKKAQRVVETMSKTTTEPRVEQKAKHVAKRSRRLLEKTNKSSLALAESGHGAANATNGAKLESPDPANGFSRYALRR